jgi:hypothetical protein
VGSSGVPDCPTKITFAQMRDGGVRGIAPTTASAIRSRSAAMYGPNDLRFTCHAAAACQPVRIFELLAASIP